MSVTVTMLQTRLGENGSLWLAGESYSASLPFAEFLINSNLATGTLPPAEGRTEQARFELLPQGGAALLGPGGTVYSLVSAVEVGPALTATGNGFTGAGYYAGINVSAYNGGPQTVVVYEGTDTTGQILQTISVTGTGVYVFSPGLRVRFGTGLHITISGGTSRTLRALVEPI